MASGSVGAVHLWYGNMDAASNLSNLSQTSACQLPVGDEVVEKLILPIEGNQGFDRNHMIKDIKPITFGHDEYLAALSDKELELFKWTETQVTSEDSDSEDSDGTIRND
ncbi:hypothetical protein BGZ76_006447 [Entomortierella beljakovae]|nr:hypothetical protein BGZ76_006447 [Entomortierella beljakovae]